MQVENWIYLGVCIILMPVNLVIMNKFNNVLVSLLYPEDTGDNQRNYPLINLELG